MTDVFLFCILVMQAITLLYDALKDLFRRA